MNTAKRWMLVTLLTLGGAAAAEEIGSVNTVFKWVGPDHTGVTCYVSRAKKGGVSGALGLAEDTADASISCRQVGPIQVPDRVANRKADGEQVFKEHLSLLFKTLQVVRFYDAKRNTLVYLTYSDKLVEGSPKNSVSAVPIEPWGQAK